MTDPHKFPHPVYAETVLAPLFDGVKRHFVPHLDAINRAHLVMLAETGILSPDDAGRIARALKDIADETDVAALTYTGAHEDYFFLVEAELRRRLGDLGGALHTARSRNDMDHTIFKMALADRVDALFALGIGLARTLLQRAEAGADTLIVAYTHGQPAQPSTLGHYLAAVLETLLGDLERLEFAARSLQDCPMGAAAITTTGFPIDRQRVAELLGFRAPKLNSYAAIAGVDYVTGLYSAIKLVFLHLGRVTQDFAFWSAFEVGQLRLPDSLVQVSSIMPQKRNPVPIEHMRHMASVTCGRCDMVVNTMHNTPFTDMNDSEGMVQEAGFQAFDTAGRMLSLMTAVIRSATIDAARVTANADAACITVTELADTLVREEGLSFRTAHEIASDTARAVIAAGTPLTGGYSAFADAFAAHAGRRPGLGPDRYHEAVSMEGFVRVRNRPGGPAHEALTEALGLYARRIEELETARNRAGQLRAQAAAARDRAFDRLIDGGANG